MDDMGPSGGRIDQGKDEAMGEPKASASVASGRAASVGIADFSEQLSSGVLRALDSHSRQQQAGGSKIYKPWIWAGIWIGPHDGGGPFGPGGAGPLAGGGSVGNG
jgi:hypothetical protein